MEDAMVGLVREMVQALVDDPAAVEVRGVMRGGIWVLDLKVAESDIGKVIGKQGRTARSLRTILSAAAMQRKMRCDLNISEAG